MTVPDSKGGALKEDEKHVNSPSRDHMSTRQISLHTFYSIYRILYL